MAEPASAIASPPAAPARRRGGAAALVAGGILLSRIAGFARQRALGYYLGISPAADAYAAALRIPNFLQNLLGEGVLSASFIPVYASLRARGEPEAARQVAGAVAGLLTLVTGLLAVVGVAATPWLLDAIAPGFTGETRALTVSLVRVFFPGISLLVLSAFCIGVLNSHGKFFLSYAAPVVWNLAIVAALVLGGRLARGDDGRIALFAAAGAVAGGALQLGVQLPSVLRALGSEARLSLGRGDANVAAVVRSFLPVVAGRGVVQLSAYVDTLIASYLPGTVAAFAYAQLVYTLPISLFGMAVSAASLPSMSEDAGAGDKLRAQLEAGLRTIAFPVVACVAAFLALGDVICGALFQTGRFAARDTSLVWLILAGSTVGLLAATLGRLYSSAFYALRDTKTPLRYATLRVLLTAALGVWAGLFLPAQLGLDRRFGAAGLTASAGLAGWVEFWLLRRAIARRIGEARLPPGLLWRLWLAGAAAAGLGVAARLGCAHAGLLGRPWPRAAVVFALFAAAYLGTARLLGVEEATVALDRVRRRLGRRPGRDLGRSGA